MDLQDDAVEYENCESKNGSLYVLPDSSNENNLYTAAERASLPQSSASNYTSIDQRSNVKSFVNQFEEKLRVDCNAPAQFQQSAETDESYYSNIRHVLPVYQSSKSNQSLEERSGNEVESSNVCYANDVFIHSLNIQHENETVRILSPHTADLATSLDENLKEHSSNEDQWYTEQQKERERSKLLDNDRRVKNHGETGRSPSTSIARSVWRKRKLKQNQTDDDDKAIELQRNENIRSCGGELIKDSNAAMIMIDAARLLLMYLREISAKADISSNENDIESILGVTDMLKRHKEDMEHLKETTMPEYEEIPTREQCEVGEAHESQGSSYCTLLGQRESDSAGECKEHFDQIVEELENLGQQILYRRKGQDVESGIGCIDSSLRQRSNKLILLIFLIILVFWILFIYLVIKKKYILIA